MHSCECIFLRSVLRFFRFKIFCQGEAIKKGKTAIKELGKPSDDQTVHQCHKDRTDADAVIEQRMERHQRQHHRNNATDQVIPNLKPTHIQFMVTGNFFDEQFVGTGCEIGFEKEGHPQRRKNQADHHHKQTKNDPPVPRQGKKP